MPNQAQTSNVFLLNHLRHFKNLKTLIIKNPIDNSNAQSGYLTINVIESLTHLQKLQETASGYISWYNYPLNLMKEIQGNIYQINR